MFESFNQCGMQYKAFVSFLILKGRHAVSESRIPYRHVSRLDCNSQSTDENHRFSIGLLLNEIKK